MPNWEASTGAPFAPTAFDIGSALKRNITPFNQTEEHGPSFAHPAPDFIEGEEEYEIEAILCHKKKGKGLEYFVRWKGYEDALNEWVPEKELRRNAKELLDEYREVNNL